MGRLVALWLLLAGWSVMPVAAGTVSGRVEMIEKKGRKAEDLSHVVIWVEGPAVEPEPAAATITMVKKSFEPPLVVVPVGGTVAFPNLDPILHNAFSVSGENRFDLELYKKPESRSQLFEHPGVVRVYCNIHPQMSAYVVVRDNPFWAQARQDGGFSIAGVPPGTWTVRAWHPRAEEVAREVTVPETGAVSLALTLDASKYRRVPHRNKHGKKYKKGRY
jgi:plastocyanin